MVYSDYLGLDTSLFPSTLGTVAWELDNMMGYEPWMLDEIGTNYFDIPSLTSTVDIDAQARADWEAQQAFERMMQEQAIADQQAIIAAQAEQAQAEAMQQAYLQAQQQALESMAQTAQDDALAQAVMQGNQALTEQQATSDLIANSGNILEGIGSDVGPAYYMSDDKSWTDYIGGAIGAFLGLGVNPALLKTGYDAGTALQNWITGGNTDQVKNYGDGMTYNDLQTWLGENALTVNDLSGLLQNSGLNYETGGGTYGLSPIEMLTGATGGTQSGVTAPSWMYDVNSTMPYYGSEFPQFAGMNNTGSYDLSNLSNLIRSSQPTGSTQFIGSPSTGASSGIGTGNTGIGSISSAGTGGTGATDTYWEEVLPDYFGTYDAGLYDIPEAVRYPDLPSAIGTLSGIEQPSYIGYDPATYNVPDISSMLPTSDWYSNIAPEVMAGIRAPYEEGSALLQEQLNSIGGLGNQSTGVSGQGAAGLGKYWADADTNMGLQAWQMMYPQLQQEWAANLDKNIYDAGQQNLLRTTEADYLQSLADQQYGLRQQEATSDYNALLEKERADYQAMQNYRSEILQANQMPWTMLPSLLGGSYSSPVVSEGTDWLAGIGAGLGTYGQLDYLNSQNNTDMSGGDWASIIGSIFANA